jgi:hypothetical protein
LTSNLSLFNYIHTLHPHHVDLQKPKGYLEPERIQKHPFESTPNDTDQRIMSEEVKVEAPAAEEVKTETNGDAVKTEEQKPKTEEQKPVVAAAAPEKDASTLPEEEREALAAKVAKQSMYISSLIESC